MALVMPDDLVRASGLTEDELRLELAVTLYRENRLTLGQAARLAGMPQDAMLGVLAKRQVPVHHGVEDLLQDVANLKRLFPA